MSLLAHVPQCPSSWSFPCLLLFPCHNQEYVSLPLFQRKTSRSKDITIVMCIICCYSFCQSGGPESDRCLAFTHWLPRIIGFHFPPMVGSHGGPDCKKHFSMGRPLGPQDCTRGCPVFEVHASTVSNSAMYQTTRFWQIGLSQASQKVFPVLTNSFD